MSTGEIPRSIRPRPSSRLSRCQRSVSSVTKLRLLLLRILRFFAANFPNLFTPDYADIADKKSVSVLSVPSCKIRLPSAFRWLTYSIFARPVPLCGQSFGAPFPALHSPRPAATDRGRKIRRARPCVVSRVVLAGGPLYAILWRSWRPRCPFPPNYVRHHRLRG